MELFLFFPFSLSSLYFWKKREYTCFRNQSSPGRYLDGTLSPCRNLPDRSRQPGLDPGARLCKASAFPFPDLYLDDKVAQLTREDPAVLPFLQQCLRQFVNHEYGHLSSLDLVENFLNRDVHQKNTWMRGNYPSPAWGEIRLEIFYDMGLFHLEDVPPRALALEQSRKEAAHTADLP